MVPIQNQEEKQEEDEEEEIQVTGHGDKSGKWERWRTKELENCIMLIKYQWGRGAVKKHQVYAKMIQGIVAISTVETAWIRRLG